jgi:AcrR family transcriptional regulator
MSPKALRQQHREQLRAAILDAAREDFVREGYENFSMRKLASRIGYSPGTLYLHFDGKADLLHGLVEEGFDQLLQALGQAHDSEDPVQSLKDKLRAYIEFGLGHPSHYHFAFLLRRERKPETVEPHAAFDVLRRAVRRCVEQGPFDSLDVETTSQTLWTAIHGVTSLLIVHPEFPWVDKTELIDAVLDTTIAGLRSRATGGAELEKKA